jgi:hypothetical protein
MSTKQIDGLLSRQRLTRVHAGIYRLPDTPPTWEQRALAACYATGGVASHRAALKLWGVRLQAYSPDDWPVEVTVARANAARPAGVIVHRSPDLDTRSVATRSSVPLTTPQRMLVDLGAVLDYRQVTQAVEQCIVSRLLSVATIRNELERIARRGRRGAGTLRAVLADWPLGDARPESVLEVAFARLSKAAGLPRPEFQYPILLNGRVRRIDFAYPCLRIAIEVDGFGCRTDRAGFQDERWRQNDLVRAGWQVLRFTWDDVIHRADYVAATIRSLM